MHTLASRDQCGGLELRTPCWSLWEGDGGLSGRDRGDRGTRSGLSGEEVTLDEIRIS